MVIGPTIATSKMLIATSVSTKVNPCCVCCFLCSNCLISFIKHPLGRGRLYVERRVRSIFGACMPSDTHCDRRLEIIGERSTRHIKEHVVNHHFRRGEGDPLTSADFSLNHRARAPIG